jgi:hypothetical protein
VEVELLLVREGVVACTYRVRAREGTIAYPDPAEPLDSQRLWEHTCCELFVAREESSAYAEWNFSPTGQHAYFEFDDYRQRCEPPRGRPSEPILDAVVNAGGLELRAEVPVGRDLGTSCLLAPTVVLEGTDGVNTYWAVRHPGPRPDFHHRDGIMVQAHLDPGQPRFLLANS